MWDGALRVRQGAASHPREEHKAGVVSGPAKRRPGHEERGVRRAGHGGSGLGQHRARLAWRAHHAGTEAPLSPTPAHADLRCLQKLPQRF